MDNTNVPNVPRGIEVLVKKASVDPAFKELLIEQRAAAADQIELTLEPAEAMMLDNIPVDQLRVIIDRTQVPAEHRRAFLGTAAAAMLAVLGAPASEASGGFGVTGIRPPSPKEQHPSPTETKLIDLIAKELGIPKQRITRESSIGIEIKADAKQREAIRQGMEKEFAIAVPNEVFGGLKDVGHIVVYVTTARSTQPSLLNLLAKRFKVQREQIAFDTSLETDLKISARKQAYLKTALQQQYRVTLSPSKFTKCKTVGDLAGCVTDAVTRRGSGHGEKPTMGSFGVRPNPIPTSRGVRPDLPGANPFR